MTEPQAHATSPACENCDTVLQGHYCHICGQHAHSPLRNFAHAVEEVFESFWHLDGRIFRTVRDLFVPGRVAAGYLAGHRVRYVAPLRLFVIISLLTFFVGKVTLHIDDTVFSSTSSPAEVEPGAGPAPASQARTGAPARTAASSSAPGTLADAAAAPKRELDTIDAVIADRNRQLGEFKREALESDGGWLLTPLSGTVQSGIDDGARGRMRKLGASEAEIDLAMARADLELEKAEAASKTAAAAKGDADAGWISRWMKKRGDRFTRNSEAMRENPDEFIRLFLGAVPGALFLLVPLFALFLKVMHIGSGRGYLEHLVVALYSHAFLLATLLVLFTANGLVGLAPAAWIWPKVVIGIGAAALFFAVPAYLLVMQKRVYGHRWWVTVVKFLVIGSVYTVLLTCALLYAVIAGMSS